MAGKKKNIVLRMHAVVFFYFYFCRYFVIGHGMLCIGWRRRGRARRIKKACNEAPTRGSGTELTTNQKKRRPKYVWYVCVVDC